MRCYLLLKCLSIFDGHAGALRQILQHRVGRIPEQGDGTPAPFLDWFAIAEHPHAPGLDAPEKFQDVGVFARESFEQLLSVTEDVPAFLITIAVENCDEVENFSAAKRVLNQVSPWTGP